MKIYSVTVTEKRGVTRHLWTSYQSAAQSFGCWTRKRGPGKVTFDSVNVPDDAWKPVDKANESRLNRVAVLWEQLVASDQEGLDALLDELVKRVTPVRKPVILTPGEKTEAMAALDRLVS